MDSGKKRSCETQFIVTVQEIASRLSKGDQVDIILLDFEKAFDIYKVYHSRLLYKMDYYGVMGIAHSWIKPFPTANKKSSLKVTTLSRQMCYPEFRRELS